MVFGLFPSELLVKFWEISFYFCNSKCISAENLVVVVATTFKVLSLSLNFEKDCQSIVLVKLDFFAILNFILNFEGLSGEKWLLRFLAILKIQFSLKFKGLSGRKVQFWQKCHGWLSSISKVSSLQYGSLLAES